MLFWTKFEWNLQCNKNEPLKSFHFNVILNEVLKMAKKCVVFLVSVGDKDILRL